MSGDKNIDEGHGVGREGPHPSDPSLLFAGNNRLFTREFCDLVRNLLYTSFSAIIAQPPSPFRYNCVGTCKDQPILEMIARKCIRGVVALEHHSCTIVREL